MIKKTGVLLPAVLSLGLLFPAALAPDEGAPRPGFYTGTAQGYDGEVTVTLEIKNRVIVSASAEGDGESPRIGTAALDELPPRMVRTNSVEVDVISGATITSRAVLEAAARALKNAGLTNADLISHAPSR